VKMTVNKRMAKSHGYYLQHAKEVCLVGRRGAIPPTAKQVRYPPPLPAERHRDRCTKRT